MSTDRPGPKPLPGTWPSASFRNEYFHEQGSGSAQDHTTESSRVERSFPLFSSNAPPGTEALDSEASLLPIGSPNTLNPPSEAPREPISDENTAVPSPNDTIDEQRDSADVGASMVRARDSSPSDVSEAEDESDENKFHEEVPTFELIKTSQSEKPAKLGRTQSKPPNEDEIFRALSRKRTDYSNRQGSYISSADDGEEEEIQRLMSRMFGRNRQAQSEDEKTRHVGVVFKNLTVKGVGLGAALQPTIGDPFMAPFRLIRGLFTNPRHVSGTPPIRTLLNNFSGCVRPGELLLVLGRPGAGCSTFLKVFGNQRSGFKEIKGDVTYGGTDSATIAKQYKSEVLYNPEDDLHYATLSVKNTLQFALKTRTPGKASRNEGESRAEYVKEFLRVVTKLFWIEHTLKTKVGNEYVRGVSGGEKKRVSIAEAMITRASVQAWDNSTRGLDASTALEYVQSIRSLTNMANISTAVALYQAGESLFELFDKVILIEAGKCLYFGPTENAASYFEGLGFQRPARWTTADFLTSVTDPHERQVREGWENRIPRSIEQFEEAFAKSDLQQQNLRDIEDFDKELEEQRRQRQEARSKASKKKNFALPFHKQVLACTQRQFLVMIGDKQSLGGKWGGILFQSLIVGSLFYDLPQSSAGV